DLRGILAQPIRLVVSVLFIAIAAYAIWRFPKDASAAQAGGGTGTPVAMGSSSASTAPDASDNPQKRVHDLWAGQPRVDLGVPADGAKVVIVKFNDWQCPSCKLSFFAYKPVLDKYAQTMLGAVKVVTRDYPLSNRCNFSMPREMHPAACEAAAAVRLAT